MKNITISTIIIFIVSILNISAQKNDNDLLFKAMNTEMKRVISTMKKDSLAPPFYISLYSYDKIYRYSLSTSFGKIKSEDEENNISRDAYSRLLVGDYNINQINFGDSPQRINLPIEDDEIAIRTALWQYMEFQYKSATKNYVDKISWMKNRNFSKEEMDIPHFEKRNPVILIKNTDFLRENSKNIKNQILEWSKLLTEKAKKTKLTVDKLDVSFSLTNDIVRFCDTEGSEVKYPVKNAIISFRLEGLNTDGEQISAGKSFVRKDIEKIFDEKILSETIENLISTYKLKYEMHANKEPYMGPVLVTGNFMNSINDEILQNLYAKPITQYSEGNKYQKMPGVRMISKQLSFVLQNGDSANTLQNVNTVVAPVDDEGVIPFPKIQLIENGIIKNLLTTRKPSVNYPNSNGNFQLSSWTPAAGVTILTGNVQYSFEELKKLLIDEAKMQGLKYALILSDNGVNYKVDTQTGETSPIIGTFNFSGILKSLRHVIAVENKQASSYNGKNQFPNSLLFEEMELEPYYVKSKTETYVSRPNIW